MVTAEGRRCLPGRPPWWKSANAARSGTLHLDGGAARGAVGIHISDNRWDDVAGAMGAGMGALLPLHRHPEWIAAPHLPASVPLSVDLMAPLPHLLAGRGPDGEPAEPGTGAVRAPALAGSAR